MQYCKVWRIYTVFDNKKREGKVCTNQLGPHLKLRDAKSANTVEEEGEHHIVFFAYKGVQGRLLAGDDVTGCC